MPAPDGAFDGEAVESRGRFRDLDSAVSFAMTTCELGLVEQADVPNEGGPKQPGSRTYRFVTMRDGPIWVRATWDGVSDQSLGELAAGRTDQPVRWHAFAERHGDADIAKCLLENASERLGYLRKHFQ